VRSACAAWDAPGVAGLAGEAAAEPAPPDEGDVDDDARRDGAWGVRPQPERTSAAIAITEACRTARIYSPTGWRTTKPAASRTSGCQPIPALPSCGPAALCVSQRSPATYMNTWSALA
jgi:hypothetical protein